MVQVTSAPGSPPAAATSPDTAWTVLEGDCVEVLAGLPAASLDAMVCDPPYGIGFHGERWDRQAIHEAAARTARRPLTAGESYQAWCRQWAGACLRALRPGGHLVAFGSPRTAHRVACALEEAGFALRDTLIWLYGTGLPKSRRLPGGRATALKPAWEPILLARRPLAGPLERNLAAHGTGALNADACRVEGRFPANVLASHHPDCTPKACTRGCPLALIDAAADRARAPSGSLRQASRLFYSPKASRTERDAGCEHLPSQPLDLFPNAQHGRRPRPAANPHPTVKPLALMRWLIRLTAPEGGLVLDPFCGSGSTGCAAALEHRRFVGIELNPAYVEIARARIAHWTSRAANPSEGEQEDVAACPFEHSAEAPGVNGVHTTTPDSVGRSAEEQRSLIRLEAGTIEAIAQRVAELLAPRLQPLEPPGPRRLLTATEVSEWWGVDRRWVYAHADELGARRLGTGERPRLRFDPDEVDKRLAALNATPDRPRSLAMAADSPSTRFRPRAELWSSRN